MFRSDQPVRGRTGRDLWTQAATDHVLDHGLIGLSLRPLAAALGTSDRMLIYRFGSKADLVVAVLRASNDRSTALVNALAPSSGLSGAVADLWSAMKSPTIDRCQRLYVEAAALGLFGKEPYASLVRDANVTWVAALVQHMTLSGVDEAAALRVAKIIDATFLGLQLEMRLDDPRDAFARDQVVADLATTLSALTGASRAEAGLPE